MLEAKQIPLNKLVADKNNPRHGKPNQAKLDNFEASIRAHGLIQPLTVQANDDGGYTVVAGNTRLAALQKIAANDDTPDLMVNCQLASSEDALSIALAENTIREDMHPADKYLAFANLIKQGKSKQYICDAFHLQKSDLEKLLKLGQLDTKVLNAFRKDEIDIKTAMVLTGASSKVEQRRLLDEYGDNSWQIGQIIQGEAIESGSMIGEFIYNEYMAANGAIRTNLFDDSAYLDDVELVHKLVDEKLQAEVTRLEDMGFAFVRIGSNDYGSDDKGLKRVLWDEPKAKERSKYGVIIRIGYKGKINHYHGYMTTAQARAENGEEASGEKVNTSQFTDALLRDVNSIKRAIAQHQMVGDLANVSVLKNIMLAREVFCEHNIGTRLFDVNAKSYVLREIDEAHVFTKIRDILIECAGSPFISAGSLDEAFQIAIASMVDGVISDEVQAEAEKLANIAFAISFSEWECDSENFVKYLASICDDVSELWRPAQSFWKRVKKDVALDIAKEVIGEKWANERETSTKSVLTETLTDVFVGKTPQHGSWLTKEQREAALAWQPEEANFQS